MAENLAVSAGGTAYTEKDYAALIMNTPVSYTHLVAARRPIANSAGSPT